VVARLAPEYTSRFIPLAVGNEWHYEITDRDDRTTGFRQFEVIGDTTYEGNDHLVYLIRHYDEARTYLRDELCAARILHEEYGVTARVARLSEEPGVCSYDGFPEPIIPYRYAAWDAARVVIGNQQYDVEATTWAGSGGCGTGGYCLGWMDYSAIDLGNYLRIAEDLSGPRITIGKSMLRYAYVGGTTYGVRAVGLERAATGRASPEIGAYPNPFMSTLSVRIFGVRHPVVRLYNMVGKLIAIGEMANSGNREYVARFTRMHDLPAGVYLVDVRDEGHRMSGILVIKL
jgi:hypothetical protein